MNRWVRALPVLVIGALVAITTATATRPVPAVAGAATVARASGTSGEELQLTPVGATGAANGDGFAFVVDPGVAAKRSFVITNRSTSRRVTVRLAGVDAQVRAGGNVEYAKSASTDGPATWLSLSDVVTTLEPGAHVQVSLTVTPPANAIPGTVTAGLVAQVDHAASAADNTTVDDRSAVSVPISIKINGAPTALVSIASVHAVNDHGHEYLDITFQNSGATPNTMSGQVRVAGAHPQSTPVHATIASLTHTNLRVPFTMPNGAKTVPVSVSTTDARGDEATWGGNVGFASTAAPVSASPAATHSPAQHASAGSAARGASLPPIPLIVVALLFLGAAVWFALEIRRNRASRRTAAGTRPPTRVASAALAVPADAAQMGAVAAQLGALVEAIDRLVGRLGEVTVPGGGAAAVPVTPAAPVAAPTSPSPASVAEGPAPANPAPMFYAPAANRGPSDEFDPYDWPTQEQLDQFAARRRAAQSDM